MLQATFDAARAQISRETFEPIIRRDIKEKGYECGTACDGYIDTTFSEFGAVIDAYEAKSLADFDAYSLNDFSATWADEN